MGAVLLAAALFFGALYALTRGDAAPNASASSGDAGSAADGAANDDGAAPAASAAAAVDPDRDPMLVDLDQRVEAALRATQQRDDDWLPWQVLANRYSDRARATGDWNDYKRAQDAFERAFAIAPAGAGPHAGRAALNYAMHRLPQVLPDLDAIEHYAMIYPHQRRLVASLRAEVAYHQGRYDDARTMYEANLADERSSENLAAWAQLQWKTNHFDEAVRALDEADANVRSSATESWLCLVRGLMELDRGRWDDALAAYRSGLGKNPGDHALEEHLAEVLVMKGDDVIALPMYEHLVEATHDPEFMDQLASIHAAHGDHEGTVRWTTRAREGWEARMEIFPEAAYGHALHHWLALERDPDRTVELAEANVAARPNGETKTLLAEAYLAADRAADARRVVEQVLTTTPWSTAELHATASRAYEATGDPAAAARERRLALAINPHAFD